MIEAIAKSLCLLAHIVLVFAYILIIVLGVLKFSLLALSVLSVFGVWFLAGVTFLKRFEP